METMSVPIGVAVIMVCLFFLSRKSNKDIIRKNQPNNEPIEIAVEVEYSEVIRLLFDNKDKEYQMFLKNNITKTQLKFINAFIVENKKDSFYKTERIFVLLTEDLPYTSNITKQLLDELVNIYLQMYILSDIEQIYNKKIQEIYNKLELTGNRPNVSYERLARTSEYMREKNIV